MTERHTGVGSAEVTIEEIERARDRVGGLTAEAIEEALMDAYPWQKSASDAELPITAKVTASIEVEEGEEEA